MMPKPGNCGPLGPGGVGGVASGGDCSRAREDLIDFVDGQMPQDRAREIECHLATCSICKRYVDSLRRALALAAEDRVPDPPRTYWVHFESAVRERAGRRGARARWRLVSVLAPGLAVAALVVWLATRAEPPSALKGAPGGIPGGAAGAVAGALSPDSLLVSFLTGASDEEIASIEAYLSDAEDIYELVGDLTPEEKQNLVAKLSDLLRRKG